MVDRRTFIQFSAACELDTHEIEIEMSQAKKELYISSGIRRLDDIYTERERETKGSMSVLCSFYLYTTACMVYIIYIAEFDKLIGLCAGLKRNNVTRKT